jgi:hypothetical protein
MYFNTNRGFNQAADMSSPVKMITDIESDARSHGFLEDQDMVISESSYSENKDNSGESPMEVEIYPNINSMDQDMEVNSCDMEEVRAIDKL